MLDENEFLSPYGIRSLSKFHEQHPYVFHVEGKEYRVDYLPAESNTGMFGGNSNWRGPVWMPVNVLIIRALQQFYMYYGDGFRIECPTGSGKLMNLFEVSKEISDRLGRIFLRDESGRRPVYGGTEKFQTDPHWRDHILFYEYFHGDNGAGLGANHQTGWTGLVAKLIQLYAPSIPSASSRWASRPRSSRAPRPRRRGAPELRPPAGTDDLPLRHAGAFAPRRPRSSCSPPSPPRPGPRIRAWRTSFASAPAPGSARGPCGSASRRTRTPSGRPAGPSSRPTTRPRRGSSATSSRRARPTWTSTARPWSRAGAGCWPA